MLNEQMGLFTTKYDSMDGEAKTLTINSLENDWHSSSTILKIIGIVRPPSLKVHSIIHPVDRD
jgi:hypothetical protein